MALARCDLYHLNVMGAAGFPSDVIHRTNNAPRLFLADQGSAIHSLDPPRYLPAWPTRSHLRPGNGSTARVQKMLIYAERLRAGSVVTALCRRHIAE